MVDIDIMVVMVMVVNNILLDRRIIISFKK